MKTKRPVTVHDADVCVIGGGLSGMCAAIAAARHGAKVVLIHDRPVFGGNASSEIRMWPLGARGKNNRETGIFEEIVLENMRRNPTRSYPVWDGVLYEKIKSEPNITAVMNASVFDGEEKDSRIVSVSAWQLTTYKTHTVHAKIFIDCSGDCIISTFSSAKFRHGREARDEFGEEAAPLKADGCTMGNSCLLQARQTAGKVEFTPPGFIRRIEEPDLRGRYGGMTDLRGNNFWWLELGGTRDCLGDCEEIRDDLVALSYGVWDYIKNRDTADNSGWELDFAGFLPGKRESRRYVGRHILTQPEVASGGAFDDTVAYGGWSIDDHPPLGFDHRGEPNRVYPCPSPFGIPYGCIVSENVSNLMFAGRNISATHAAMAASRVMGTCAVLGQAAGTAAAMASSAGMDPARFGELHMSELQQTLLYDDCYLPGFTRKISPVCRRAKLTPGYEALRNGIDRPVGGDDNGCFIKPGDSVEYTLDRPSFVSAVRLVLDSDLDRRTVTGGIPEVRDCPTICNRPLNMTPFRFQTTMTSDFDILCDGALLQSVRGNRQRLVRIDVNKTVSSIALVPLSTTGNPYSHVFSFDFN